MLSVGNPKSLCEFLNDVRDLGPFHHSTSALVSELAFVIMLAPHGHKMAAHRISKQEKRRL